MEIIIIINGHLGGTGWPTLAYHGNMDAPAHQSLGWHLWQVPTTQKPASFDERMSNIEFHTNDVNGPGACSEGVASGRCPVDQQRRPGSHTATSEQRQKRLGWSKEADQVRQIKNKKWLETVEQEEIAIRVRHEHQEIENTELHATDTSSSSSSSWYPSKTSKLLVLCTRWWLKSPILEWHALPQAGQM